MWRLVHDTDEAHAVGTAAREAALARYGLGRFLADCDVRLEEVADVLVDGWVAR